MEHLVQARAVGEQVFADGRRVVDQILHARKRSSSATWSKRRTGNGGSQRVGEVVVPVGRGGTQIILLPIVRHGIAVWVRTCGRQFKGRGNGDRQTVSARIDRQDAVARRSDGEHTLPLPLTVNATISLMLWLWKWSSELL